MLERDLDCLVISTGPAGLTAATYLARYRRRFVVLNGSSSRLSLILTSHNLPGFPEGIHGDTLLERMIAQATSTASIAPRRAAPAPRRVSRPHNLEQRSTRP